MGGLSRDGTLLYTSYYSQQIHFSLLILVASNDTDPPC